jgi:hypothetical protein
LEEVINILKINILIVSIITITFLFSSQVFSFDAKKIEGNLKFATSLKDLEEIERRVEELNEIEKNIDEELKVNQNDPELLFLKSRAIISYIYTINPPFTDVEFEKIKELKIESSTWMLKSAEFNDNNLSLEKLYVMHDFSSELAVYSVDEIIKIDSTIEEKDIIELKRSKIDNLIRLGRFGEARDEMTETNREHPTFKSTEWDEAFEGQILEVQAKLKATLEKEADTPIEKPEEKPIKNQVVTADTTVDEEMNPMVLTEDSNPRLIQLKSVLEQYGIFILAFFVFLGMYFFSRRKSKK